MKWICSLPAALFVVFGSMLVAADDKVNPYFEDAAYYVDSSFWSASFEDSSGNPVEARNLKTQCYAPDVGWQLKEVGDTSETWCEGGASIWFQWFAGGTKIGYFQEQTAADEQIQCPGHLVGLWALEGCTGSPLCATFRQVGCYGAE